MKRLPRSIDEIIENKWLVEFDRKPLDKNPLFGFVMAATEEFTLIQEFDTNAFLLESYTVIRNKDIRKYAVYDNEDYFLSEVIRCRGIEPQDVKEIDLASWPSILGSVSQKYGFAIDFARTARLSSEFPALGSPRYSFDTGLEKIRFWSMKKFPYLISYTEEKDRIDVWRVLHSHMNIREHLSGSGS